MASSPFYPEAEGGISSLVMEAERAKEHSVHLTHRYVKSPQTDLGQLIPRSGEAPRSGLFVIPAETEPQNAVHGSSTSQQRSGGGNGMVLAAGTASEEHDAQGEEKRFMAFLKDYERDAKDKYKTGIDPSDKHTVEDLLVVVDGAVDKYQNADQKGLWGKVRLAFRKLGASGDVVTGWLGLLPSESEYLSVICGGLKLIITVGNIKTRGKVWRLGCMELTVYKAASRMKSVADKVLEALCDLPVLLGSTKRVLRCFPELRAHSDALYKSTLVALGHMLAYLGRKSGLKRLLKAAFQQTQFEASLVAKIDDIRKQRDAFNEEADTCQKEMTKRMDVAMEASVKSGEELSKGVQETKEMAEVCVREQRRISEQNDTIISAGSEIMRQLDSVDRNQTIHTDLMKQILGFLQAHSGVVAVGQEAQKPLGSCEESVEASPRKTEAENASSALADAHHRIRKAERRWNWLLGQLDYDENVPEQDLKKNLGLAARIPSDEQDRCMFIITKAPALAKWIKSQESSALVINGRSRYMERQRAGVSFVCARLIWSIGRLQAPTLLPLHFFCAQHSDKGPADVVNSLLAQLLWRCSDDIDVSEAKELGGFRSERLKSVFKRFRMVLDLLPASVAVFCMIDSISIFVSDKNTASDAEELIKRLINLTQREAGKTCTFKLLLTAPKTLVSTSVKGAGIKQILVPLTVPKMGSLTVQKLKFGLEISGHDEASSSGDSSEEEGSGVESSTDEE